MVYTSPFFKRGVVQDYTPAQDGTYEWELSDSPLAAVWITIKGDVDTSHPCINNMADLITSLDVWHGAFNVVHYSHTIDALVMNCKLKGHWPYLVNSTQTDGEVSGVTFPVLFGAPYLNLNMALPGSHSNRKRLVLGIDIDNSYMDGVKLDIAEVILPGASPVGCIKQEELDVTAPSTGDLDVWLQRNWDLLKLDIWGTTIPHSTSFTSTIERAGLEIDDVYFGYEGVPWEILHGELMDELEGSGPVEDHIHADPSSGSTGLPTQLEHWIANYAEFDFFYQYDLKWRAPLKDCSTAKFKYNCGAAEAFRLSTASYVLNSQLERGF